MFKYKPAYFNYTNPQFILDNRDKLIQKAITYFSKTIEVKETRWFGDIKVGTLVYQKYYTYVALRDMMFKTNLWSLDSVEQDGVYLRGFKMLDDDGYTCIKFKDELLPIYYKLDDKSYDNIIKAFKDYINDNENIPLKPIRYFFNYDELIDYYIYLDSYRAYVHEEPSSYPKLLDKPLAILVSKIGIRDGGHKTLYVYGFNSKDYIDWVDRFEFISNDISYLLL